MTSAASDPSQPARPGGEAGLLLEGVTKAFGREGARTPVLDGLDLRVPRGCFATLIGPSGCGKSTLLKVAAGLVPADGGRVSLFGEEVTAACANKHVGYVPQTPALLPWRTVLGNVRFPFQVNRRSGPPAARRAEEVLAAVGLGEVLQRRPAQLSGGMQQRVAIARAFAFDPPVLLMDEPFSALDELTREQLRHLLLALWEDHHKTVLFVTHSVTEAVVLSDLVVVMSGPPGRVHRVVPVDLPRPRGSDLEDSDAVHRLEREVRAALREATGAGR